MFSIKTIKYKSHKKSGIFKELPHFNIKENPLKNNICLFSNFWIVKSKNHVKSFRKYANDLIYIRKFVIVMKCKL